MIRKRESKGGIFRESTREIRGNERLRENNLRYEELMSRIQNKWKHNNVNRDTEGVLSISYC